jgi:hypothetical protein
MTPHALNPDALAALLQHIPATPADTAPHIAAQLGLWLQDNPDYVPGTPAQIEVVDITPHVPTLHWLASTTDAATIRDTLLALLTMLASADDGQLQAAGFATTRLQAATTLRALIPLFVDREVEITDKS